MFLKILKIVGIILLHPASFAAHVLLVHVIQGNSGMKVYQGLPIDELTYFVLSFCAFFCFLFKPTFRKYTIPTYFLLSAIIIFGFRQIDSKNIQTEQWVTSYNTTNTSYDELNKSDYQAFELLKAAIQYPEEIDTFKFQVKKGLFGTLYYGDEVKVESSDNCKISQWDQSDTMNYHYNCFRELRFHRCFVLAIQHLNVAISLDTIKHTRSLEQLAQLYTATENHEKALEVYSVLLLQAAEKLEEFEDIPSSDETDHLLDSLFLPGEEGDSLLSNFDEKAFNRLFEKLKARSALDHLNRYLDRIRYCRQKLNSTSNQKI